jgi:hypothetical protein
MSDAISPELVLVDPVLARQERTRLDEAARLDAFLGKSSPATSVDAGIAIGQAVRRAPPRYVGVVLAALVVASLSANAALAILVISQKEKATQQASATAAGRMEAAARPPIRIGAQSAPRRAATPVERHVLSWLARTPQQVLPEALRPQASRSAPAAHVACRRGSTARSYRCHVWVQGRLARPSLLVEYPAPAEGGALVTWVR